MKLKSILFILFVAILPYAQTVVINSYFLEDSLFKPIAKVTSEAIIYSSCVTQNGCIDAMLDIYYYQNNSDSSTFYWDSTGKFVGGMLFSKMKAIEQKVVSTGMMWSVLSGWIKKENITEINIALQQYYGKTNISKRDLKNCLHKKYQSFDFCYYKVISVNEHASNKYICSFGFNKKDSLSILCIPSNLLSDSSAPVWDFQPKNIIIKYFNGGNINFDESKFRSKFFPKGE